MERKKQSVPMVPRAQRWRAIRRWQVPLSSPIRALLRKHRDSATFRERVSWGSSFHMGDRPRAAAIIEFLNFGTQHGGARTTNRLSLLENLHHRRTPPRPSIRKLAARRVLIVERVSTRLWKRGVRLRSSRTFAVRPPCQPRA